MTDIIYVEIAGIVVIAAVILFYATAWYLRVTRPAKPYPGTDEA